MNSEILLFLSKILTHRPYFPEEFFSVPFAVSGNRLRLVKEGSPRLRKQDYCPEKLLYRKRPYSLCN